MPRAPVVARLAVDLFVWLTPAAVFLALYVGQYALPTAAVLPHVRVVATVWLAVAALRLLAGTLLGRRTALLVSALVLAITMTVMVGYYALVILGLNSWGRVVT